MQPATANSGEDKAPKSFAGLSLFVWMLLGIVILAGVLRFWALDSLPPGLYRDEAFNGLDALGILDGQHALFFEANNGREPTYIYLTAAAIAVFGRTVFAIRFAAALVGTLTTIAVYLLGKSWFDRRVGLLSALLWAITVWPIHLSRIGFRTILLPFLLTLALWLGTEAYKRSKTAWWLWLLSGIVYGATFYTYLAARVTPLFLGLFLLYLLATGRGRRLWPGILWFALGIGLALLPLLSLFAADPQLILGRSGQVSILSSDINQGDLWGMVWQHFGRIAGMFFIRGDTILRHNPAGRPIFDPFMALPFLIGVVRCLREWRRPAAMLALLWVTVMLLPTFLAEDAPHFLRAAGILPIVLIFPALGLAGILNWSKLAPAIRYGLALILLMGSFILTWNDYFHEYAQQPETGFLFESAARTLAEAANSAAANGEQVYMDRRLWEGWPSVQFLLNAPVTLLDAGGGNFALNTRPTTVFAWPFETPDYLAQAVDQPLVVSAESGPQARGDLDETALPFYTQYAFNPATELAVDSQRVNFENLVQLVATDVTRDTDAIIVELNWQQLTQLPDDLSVFVHISDANGIVAQDDAPLGSGFWPSNWWQPVMIVQETHTIAVSVDDATDYVLSIGVYRPDGTRLQVVTPEAVAPVDFWQLPLPSFLE